MDSLDGILLKIGLNGNGERDRQKIAIFVDLLRDVVVVELEVGGAESVDEVARVIGHRSGSHHQAHGNTQNGFLRHEQDGQQSYRHSYAPRSATPPAAE